MLDYKLMGTDESFTHFLRRKMAEVGHAAFARWMKQQGYSFRYAYFVIFNRFPKGE